MYFNLEKIKSKIIELSNDYNRIQETDLEDIKDAEILEYEALELIIEYCENKKYLINGFPTEKKQNPEYEWDDDYFCRERYIHYINLLSVDNDDISDILFLYYDSFWRTEITRSKEIFMEFIKNEIERNKEEYNFD